MFFLALWGSWLFEHKMSNGESVKFWFAGDTGYNNVLFKKIGKQFKSIDLSFVPIGSYEPRFLMKSQHVNPDEAIQVCLDVNSKKNIAMHHSTFCCNSNEEILDPIFTLKSRLEKRRLSNSFFDTPRRGETKIYNFGK